jgi:hypothetical protein
MEVSGDYRYSKKYNPEIYSLIVVSAGVLIFLLGNILYYLVTFTNKFKMLPFLEMFVNIILSAGLMAGFLCIFFFTYLERVEQEVIINNIKNVLENRIRSYAVWYNSCNKRNFK